MVSDKSSLSFYSLWVWVCGWGLLLHKSSTRCAEKSVKSRILKAFSIAPSFDENSKQTTHKKKNLSFHPFKRANSLQSNKKNVKEKKLGLNLFSLLQNTDSFKLNIFFKVFCVCFFFFFLSELTRSSEAKLSPFTPCWDPGLPKQILLYLTLFLSF